MIRLLVFISLSFMLFSCSIKKANEDKKEDFKIVYSKKLYFKDTATISLLKKFALSIQERNYKINNSFLHKGNIVVNPMWHYLGVTSLYSINVDNGERIYNQPAHAIYGYFRIDSTNFVIADGFGIEMKNDLQLLQKIYPNCKIDTSKHIFSNCELWCPAACMYMKYKDSVIPADMFSYNFKNINKYFKHTYKISTVKFLPPIRRKKNKIIITDSTINAITDTSKNFLNN